MKSIARSSCASGVLTALLFTFVTATRAQQTVQCTDPPGGTIRCGPNQLAICIINKGKVEGRCETPPPGLKTKADVRAWVLGQITDKEISPAQANDSDFRKILESGAWHTNGKDITFSFSESLHTNDFVTGEIKQQGQNNINQLGTNNQATINPEVNPNKPTRAYFCSGLSRTTGPSPTAAFAVSIDGDTKDFTNMAEMANAQRWPELLKACNEQIKLKPEWLTPYLLCGIASFKLGNRQKAQELSNYYDEHTGPSYDDPNCMHAANYLRDQLKEATAKQ